MQAHVTQQDHARRTRGHEGRDGLLVELAKLVLQHRRVEPVFAAKIVIEQRLVDAGGSGNGVGAGAGQSGLGKHAPRRGEDRRARLLAARRRRDRRNRAGRFAHG